MAKRSKRAAGEGDVELGHRIRVRRAEIDMSQQQLGEALGVSFQQVQKYEKGVNRVSTTRLSEIATVLKVPISFFFAGNGKDREVERMVSLDPSYSLRLLKAYSAIANVKVQRDFVVLLEGVAYGEKRQ